MNITKWIELQNHISQIDAVLFLILAIIILSRVQLRKRVIVAMWLFILLHGIAMIFEVHAIYLRFNHWVGVGNLSWLIAWICLATQLYMCPVAYADAFNKRIPVWSTIWYFGNILAFVLLFVSSIRFAPERYIHIFPYSLSEALFMGLLFGFGTTITIYGTYIAYQEFYREEKTPTGKLRGAISVTVSIMAVLFFSTRTLLTIVGFFIPETPLTNGMYIASMVFMVLTGMLLVFSQFPRPIVSVVLLVGSHLSKIIIYHRLSRIQSLIRQYVPSVVPPERGYWYQPGTWQRIDFFIYQSLIDILDGKQILVANGPPLPDIKLENLLQHIRAIDDQTTDVLFLISKYADLTKKI